MTTEVKFVGWGYLLKKAPELGWHVADTVCHQTLEHCKQHPELFEIHALYTGPPDIQQMLAEIDRLRKEQEHVKEDAI